MKEPFDSCKLPSGSLFFACANHEDRCAAIVDDFGGWSPDRSVLFVYGDVGRSAAAQEVSIRRVLAGKGEVSKISMPERPAIESIGNGGQLLRSVLDDHGARPVVVDASVMTKRHLLMLLRWLDDHGYWENLWVVYSEPEDYEIASKMPLSFGLSSVRQLPGFPTAPNPSRPLHLVLFLGYEGERAFGTYAILQPQRTTVVIPDPPFRPEWQGRTESQNENLLLSLPDEHTVERADAVDPMSSRLLLEQMLGSPSSLGSHESHAVCPLGTKPQALGLYAYVRECVDPPAVIYAGVLRHNPAYYSTGVGKRWLIQRPA